MTVEHHVLRVYVRTCTHLPASQSVAAADGGCGGRGGGGGREVVGGSELFMPVVFPPLVSSSLSVRI